MSVQDAPPPYRTVVFDCDSTLSDMEGIEELAGAEHAAEIARLTSMAMDGGIPLEEVFGHRLDLVQPSRDLVEEIGRRYVEKLLPNARELVAALRFLGKGVAIVSGGLLPAVRHVGEFLGVDDVTAVDVHFEADGSYGGFDTDSPLARVGGKIEVLSALAGRPGAPPLAFVGDGVTDLEAAHLAARFVAFGGVVRRTPVFDAARVSTESADYRDLVPLLLTTEEIGLLRAAPEHTELVPTVSSS